MRRVAIALAVPLLAIALASGCLDPLEPDVGPLMVSRCVDADSNPDVDVSFSQDVQSWILQRSDVDCARCHSTGGATPIGLAETGFDVSSYDTFIQGGKTSGASIVVPGHPCDSILLEKLGPAPPFGSRMPLSGPPYLSDEDLQVISDWIFEGARDN